MCTVMSPTIDTMSTEDSLNANGGLEEQRKGAKRKITLSTCGVCGADEAKYRCPACVKHSCSLLCVKKHKEESGCSGLRDKTAFVALSQFDEMNLLSDLRFLEDTTRLADGPTRDRLAHTPRVSFKARKLSACARKMNITLRFLPVTFTKSRENSTWFLSKEKRFLWHLKLVFPQSNTEYTEKRVSDGQTLEQILTPYVHPSKSDPIKRQKLKMYAQATFKDMKVFLRAEGERANSLRYHELDLGRSLRDNLSYKVLLEYPTLHVVLHGHFQDYSLKGPAKPESECSHVATEGHRMDQGTHKVAQVLPPCAAQSLNGGPTKQVTEERKSPREKRSKMEASDGKELEEGEITDGSEEEEEDGEEEEGKEKNGGRSIAEVGHVEEKSPVQESLNAVAGSVGLENVVTTAHVAQDELEDELCGRL